LILGNGGIKQTKTYNENQELNGYVMDLQKFDALLKAAEKEGSIIVEETVLNGITDKTFEL
jgi:flavin-dependent dehydrogenase